MAKIDALLKNIEPLIESTDTWGKDGMEEATQPQPTTTTPNQEDIDLIMDMLRCLYFTDQDDSSHLDVVSLLADLEELAELARKSGGPLATRGQDNVPFRVRRKELVASLKRAKANEFPIWTVDTTTIATGAVETENLKSVPEETKPETKLRPKGMKYQPTAERVPCNSNSWEDLERVAEASVQKTKSPTSKPVAMQLASPAAKPSAMDGQRYTPSAMLAKVLELTKSVLTPSTSANLEPVEDFINNIPDRLPALMAKLLWVTGRLEAHPSMITKPRVKQLYMQASRKLHKPSDVQLWISILRAVDSQDAVQQLVDSGQHHPLFLVNYLLRPNAVFSRRETLKMLVEYFFRWYSREENYAPEGIRDRLRRLKKTGVAPVLNDRRKIQHDDIRPKSLETTMRRLASHCCRIWPELLPAVARVFVSIIKTSIPIVVDHKYVFQEQSRAFNAYLQLLAQVPDRDGRRYMHLVWEAQKLLLAMASGLERPLVVTEQSFRAIRITTLGLKKTLEEQDAAESLSNTWPPYRVDRSGVDQQRDVADDLSRPLKAAIAMQEAGYPRRTNDEVIDILAGKGPDGHPTIQTRSNLHGLLKKPAGVLGPHGPWATAIRATRNAREAWAIFSNPPDGLKPDHRVYAELFAKILAGPPRSDTYRAGDSRETVEVQIPNLSDGEKARIQPPTPYQAYTMMREDNVWPEGYLLTVLMRHAATTNQAHRYFQESKLDRDVVDFLVHGTGAMRHVFKRIPYGAFQEYLALLMRLHPSGTTSTRPPNREAMERLPRAMKLLTEFTELARSDITTYTSPRPLWITALARWSDSKGIYFPPRDEPVASFQLLFERLRFIMQAKAVLGLDRGVFFRTCRAVGHSVVRYLEMLYERRTANPDAWVADPVTLLSDPSPSTAAAAAAGRERLDEGTNETVVERPENVDVLGEGHRDHDAAGTALKRREDVDTLEHKYLTGEITPLHVLAATAQYLADEFDALTAPVEPAADVDLPLPKTYVELQATDIYAYMRALCLLGDFPRLIRLLEWSADQWAPCFESLDRKACQHYYRAYCVFRVLAEDNLDVNDENTMARLGAVKALLRKHDAWPETDELSRFMENENLVRHAKGMLRKVRRGLYRVGSTLSEEEGSPSTGRG